MKIYILKAYPSPHKWEPNAWVIGYFTNKVALRKAICSHIYDLGLFGITQKTLATLVEDDIHEVSDWLDTGTVEVVEANQIL